MRWYVCVCAVSFSSIHVRVCARIYKIGVNQQRRAPVGKGVSKLNVDTSDASTKEISYTRPYTNTTNRTHL